MKFFVSALLLFSVGALAAPTKKKSSKNFFKDKTKIDNPFNLRDPFKEPMGKSGGKREGRGFSVSGKGIYTNVGDTPLNSLKPQEIKLVGVLIGKERRALVTVGESKNVIILKEGMKLGEEGTELKAILPGGMVLVEKIVNVYGEEEYLETVVPISR